MRRVRAVRIVPPLLVALGLALSVAGIVGTASGPVAGPDPSVLPTSVGSLPSAAARPPLTDVLPPALRRRAHDAPRAYASRVVIPALGIDLPVVRPPAGSTFPLCNVAMYLPSLAQPGEPGATYLYAHARVGMFLPILTASMVENGRALIGMVVEVYTSDARSHLYRIVQVRRHQRSVADAIAATASELWLQTSEGPSGAFPKVQLVALPLTSGRADPAVARPTARPLRCS